MWKCKHVRLDFVFQVVSAGRYERRRGRGGSPPGALSAPKGEWLYTEATPSGAAPTSPPEGVFRHKRRMELVKLSGRTTGRLGYTCRLEPTPSEGRQRWPTDTLSSPQPPPPSSPGRVTLSEYYGPGVAAGGWTVSTRAPNGASRAVGTHYGPTRIHVPTGAYAIGGTATLAQRCSIISATAAARTLPPG